MINIFSRVEDLNCTEFYEHSSDLKESLRDAYEKFIENAECEFVWMSDEHVVVSEEEFEYLEDELEYRLEEVYEEFVCNLEEDEEEDDYED